MKVLLAVSLLGVIWCALGEPATWAVLVAGSKGWENYRHQADVCHAYHLMVNNSIQPERIIVMMYDDVAHDPSNLNPGQLFNKPDGEDVYAGVKIDYRTDDVKIETFRNVLLGNKDAVKGIGTGRVLESGPNDLVFINFVDHGAAYTLGFPNEYFVADDFHKILKEMKEKKMFGKMVLYIEACESGSIFDNRLDENGNILASTAAAPGELSSSTYCDGSNCLGDLYSVKWMERMDKMNFTETIFEQYDVVRSAIAGDSNAYLYGDYRVGFLKFGKGGSPNRLALLEQDEYGAEATRINSRDVPLYIAQKQLAKATSPPDLLEKKMKLNRVVKGRKFADDLISDILNYLANGDEKVIAGLEDNSYRLTEDDHFRCYKSLISSFEQSCYKVSKHTYFFKHLYKFANICAKGPSETEAKRAFQVICSQQNVQYDLIL